jgi:hypothetical protein
VAAVRANTTFTGSSGTPVAAKLGIREGSRIFLAGAPKGYATLVSPLPGEVSFARRLDASVDLVHLFATERAALLDALVAIRPRLRPDAALWVSWPKRASRVPTDITEDTIRELALPMGLVDVKVCAVDAIWSGLKLVLRKALRPKI